MSDNDTAESKMDVVEWVKKWIAENMRDNGGVNPPKEAAHYKAKMLIAARAEGYTDSDFADNFDDLDHYMAQEYERVCGRAQETHR